MAVAGVQNDAGVRPGLQHGRRPRQYAGHRIEHRPGGQVRRAERQNITVGISSGQGDAQLLFLCDSQLARLHEHGGRVRSSHHDRYNLLVTQDLGEITVAAVQDAERHDMRPKVGNRRYPLERRGSIRASGRQRRAGRQSFGGERQGILIRITHLKRKCQRLTDHGYFLADVAHLRRLVHREDTGDEDMAVEQLLAITSPIAVVCGGNGDRIIAAVTEARFKPQKPGAIAVVCKGDEVGQCVALKRVDRGEQERITIRVCCRHGDLQHFSPVEGDVGNIRDNGPSVHIQDRDRNAYLCEQVCARAVAVVRGPDRHKVRPGIVISWRPFQDARLGVERCAGRQSGNAVRECWRGAFQGSERAVRQSVLRDIAWIVRVVGEDPLLKRLPLRDLPAAHIVEDGWRVGVAHGDGHALRRGYLSVRYRKGHVIDACLEVPYAPSKQSGFAIKRCAARQKAAEESDRLSFRIARRQLNEDGFAFGGCTIRRLQQYRGLICRGYQNGRGPGIAVHAITDDECDVLVGTGVPMLWDPLQCLGVRVENGAGWKLLDPEDQGIAIGVVCGNEDLQRLSFKTVHLGDNRVHDRSSVAAGHEDRELLVGKPAACVIGTQQDRRFSGTGGGGLPCDQATACIYRQAGRTVIEEVGHAGAIRIGGRRLILVYGTCNSGRYGLRHEDRRLIRKWQREDAMVEGDALPRRILHGQRIPGRGLPGLEDAVHGKGIAQVNQPHAVFGLIGSLERKASGI